MHVKLINPNISLTSTSAFGLWNNQHCWSYSWQNPIIAQTIIEHLNALFVRAHSLECRRTNERFNTVTKCSPTCWRGFMAVLNSLSVVVLRPGSWRMNTVDWTYVNSECFPPSDNTLVNHRPLWDVGASWAFIDLLLVALSTTSRLVLRQQQQTVLG